MFFILSKTLNYLVMPFTMVFILFVASLIVRPARWKKILFWTGFSLMLFFSNDFIANEVMGSWEVKTKAFKDVKPHAFGVVLTGATIPLLTPTDRVYFQRGADRVIHTVQLYKLGLIEKILVSGGTGSLTNTDEPEADKFKKVMILMGVPEEDIWIENKSRNTGESPIAVKPMLDSARVRPEDCLLITSAFHMRRSLACYHKAGLPLEPFSADFYAHPRVYYPDVLFIPQVEAMYLWQKIIKEWVGMAAYELAGYI
jgi:uncharacterized SAM-binding protein YcdF (DUF218 family)